MKEARAEPLPLPVVSLVALRDLTDLEVEAKKPRLEGVVKILWILEEELGDRVETQGEKEEAAAIAEEEIHLQRSRRGG